MKSITREKIRKLRAKEIAEIYSVGESTIWLWAKQGKIIPIKVSQRVTVFDAEEIENFFSNDEEL